MLHSVVEIAEKAHFFGGRDRYRRNRTRSGRHLKGMNSLRQSIFRLKSSPFRPMWRCLRLLSNRSVRNLTVIAKACRIPAVAMAPPVFGLQFLNARFRYG
jgi:hypothetical protein